MLLNPQQTCNTIKVADCIEYMLNNLEAGRTGEIAVDRDGDVTQIAADLSRRFMALGTLVCMKPSKVVKVRRDGRESLETSKQEQMGDTRREAAEIEVYSRHRLLDQQKRLGITLDVVAAMFRHDLGCALHNANRDGLTTVAAALNAQAGRWGDAGTFGGPPCAYSLGLVETDWGPTQTYPDFYGVHAIYFEYDLTGPDGTPGT